MARANIFRARRRVPLPKNFSIFMGREAPIRCHGGSAILDPVPEDWVWLDALVGKLGEKLLQTIRGQLAATGASHVGGTHVEPRGEGLTITRQQSREVFPQFVYM